MDELDRGVLLSSGIGIVVLLLLVFVPAGTLAYWQGWLFVAVTIVASGLYTVDLARRDRAALERRMHAGPWAETDPGQKVAVLVAMAGSFAMIVLAVLDHRFGWSTVPPAISIVANVLIAVSFLVFAAVMRANTFAAATVQVEAGQRVISTGPYASVRHPMYAGALLLLIAIPPALGSWWALVLVPVMLPALIWRLTDEENLLARNLPGYADYMHRVRWRLVPGVY